MNLLKKKSEEVDFVKRYVKPHKKKAREVMDADCKRVAEEAHVLYNLCFTKNGLYQGAYAVAHPQIDGKDPLRFYVTADKSIIINPVITRHTRHTVPYREGCTSFSDKPQVDTERWNKCEMQFQTLEDDGKGKFLLSEVKFAQLDSHDAKVAQHEIDHLNGVNVYGIYC